MLSAEQGREWTEGLCPADLFHYADLSARVRNERLREQLHVAVSAAAVTADEGKLFQAMDRRLAPAAAPGSRAPEQETARAAPLTDQQLAYAAAAAAGAERMWGT